MTPAAARLSLQGLAAQLHAEGHHTMITQIAVGLGSPSTTRAVGYKYWYCAVTVAVTARHGRDGVGGTGASAKRDVIRTEFLSKICKLETYIITI